MIDLRRLFVIRKREYLFSFFKESYTAVFQTTVLKNTDKSYCQNNTPFQKFVWNEDKVVSLL